MKFSNIAAILLSIVFLATSSEALGQRRRHSRDQIIKAYPAIGFTTSQMRGDELRGFKKWGMDAGVGAMVSLADKDRWQMSLEANFAQRGAYNATGDPYSLTGFTLNYVDIPIGVHFTDPYGGLCIGVGLNYSRLVQEPHGEIEHPSWFIPDTSDMSFLKNDIAFMLDFRIPIWRGLKLDIRFQHSILPIKKSWGFTEISNMYDEGRKSWKNDVYNSSMSFRLIYIFGEQQSYNKYNNKKKHSKKRRR